MDECFLDVWRERCWRDVLCRDANKPLSSKQQRKARKKKANHKGEDEVEEDVDVWMAFGRVKSFIGVMKRTTCDISI